MDQRFSLITLGVSDLARARIFYERLGWRGQELEETVFFQAGSVALVLWSREKLADDSGVANEPRGAFGGVVLAQNVRSTEEVDAITAAASEAGAEVTRPPAATFYGGYAACFRDPDGHVWEIAHNPGFTLAEDGSLIIPDLGGPS
jgi:predicted lactoylglutathione lyase